MTDDRRARHDAHAANPAAEITTGQRAMRRLAEQGLGTDTTIGMPAATPDLVARGLAALANDATHDHLSNSLVAAAGPAADGTLDLPASDQVASGHDLDPGQVIGHFVIRSRLGEGGMGVVLAGHDADLGRPVAIKVVKGTDDHPAHRARLLREAQVMARLEHPNVLRVYEVGFDRGRMFVAMELVDGVTLATWLKVERRHWRDIIAMFRQVGDGLAAVHRANLVHRDFKPDNVLVDRDGRARVADFGLVRVGPDSTMSADLAASLTRTGMLVGTPAYMAPEQHFGSDVDARADQYSFCVALREALIGHRPAKIEDAHWGDVPRAVRAVLDRGAAVDVTERWPAMPDLLRALDHATSRRKLVIGGAAAAIVVGGLAAFAIASAGGAPSDPSATARPGEPAIAPAPAPAPSPAPAPTGPNRVVIANEPTAHVVEDDGTGATMDEVKVDRPKLAAKLPAKGATAGPAGAAKLPAKVGQTTVTPMTPVAATHAANQHNLEGDKLPVHDMIPAHRALVRDAVRELGFGGVTITGDDRDADLREIEAKLAATTDLLERATLLYAMGLNERLRDNCIGAAKYWRDGKQLALDSTKGPIDSAQREASRTLGFRYFGRIVIAESMCELMNGRALGTEQQLMVGLRNLFGASDAERAEAWLAEGIALYEIGDEAQAKEMLLLAARRGGSKVRQIVTTYAAAVGLKLP